ncbi:GLPGLI family protein [Carboxylicivirga sediminis]|uniref:GLPGLI family protein n=1 Tax=Carboxylicivirga sediminis TaxID=2006564 RepID=A0A941F4C3_9BACT|nr:GLPGLI family protein [Carboxylicivirga sediminis]MBR8535718.1 GLPGLI family protein [Carboxylicivirga sediminis]
MKIAALIIVTFLITAVNAQQTLKVRYNYIDHTKPNTYEMELQAKDDKVLSYTIRLTKVGAGKNIRYKQTADSTRLYKDYTNDYLVYEESLGRDNLVVQEELDLFKWNHVNEKDTILDFPCKTAFAEFRGREYKAHYTTELPYTAAPWKLHGLPGVVLKVCTTDDVLVYQAESVELLDTEGPLYRPFDHKEPIDYNSFCKEYKDYRKEVIKIRKQRARQQNRPEPENNKAPRVEIIIPENRFILNEN